MRTNDDVVRAALLDLKGRLDRRGVSLASIAEELRLLKDAPSAAGEPLAHTFTVRIAHRDLEDINAMLIYADTFFELCGRGKVTRSDVARLALRWGLDMMDQEVDWRQQRATGS